MSKPLTVALTGASGFVGGHVLARLLTEGHKVRALVRSPTRFDPKVSDAKLTVVEGGLFDDRALAQLVDGVEVVVHLVGIIRQRPRRGQTFDRIHHEATRRLVVAAKQAGEPRWLQMSALGTGPSAVSTYHRTKWLGEQVVRNSGLAYTIMRPSIIHGPDGEFMEMVKGFWQKRFPPFVPYFGSGIWGRDRAGHIQPVWIDDVAQCFTEAMTRDRTIYETYPLGGPDVYTWPGFYETCKKHLPRARNKKIVAVPAWYASVIAGKPLVPFNKDQVIMSQEDSTCTIGKVQNDFGFELAAFEPTFAEYAEQIR